jgi:2-hydroxychromene-2-carboxylate isomerase
MADRMIIVAIENGHNVDQLAHRILEAHWAEDADLADRATLAGLAGQVGLDGEALLRAAETDRIHALYDTNTRAAIERGVFGSPTYILDGDIFYGQDRLEMIERALQKPFANVWPVIPK